MRHHWEAVTRGDRGHKLAQFLAAIAALPSGQLWRHNQAGDLPHTGGRISRRFLRGLVAANRKKFRGVLETTDSPQTWQITWRDEPTSKPGMRPARVKKDLPVQALQFTLSELRDARLAPIVNFKGRKPAENRSDES